jgi:hypothetical protein
MNRLEIFSKFRYPPVAEIGTIFDSSHVVQASRLRSFPNPAGGTPALLAKLLSPGAKRLATATKK